jgi:tetratricopeptide (TPR) repeat protein
MRSEGFAIFLAKANAPARRKEIIAALTDTLPNRPPHIVEIKPDTVDLLAEVQTQVGAVTGPVHLLNLEQAIPSTAEQHPILQNLNLRRPDWPVAVPQPVVFWSAEYLLGLLLRQAPDFFDWRSGSIFFPEEIASVSLALQDATWEGGADGRMPADARRERIAELDSRIAGYAGTNDPAVLPVLADWLHEVGMHSVLLGDLDRAEEMDRRALAINDQLGRREGMARAYGNLGNVYSTRGDLDRAEEMYRKSLAIDEQLGRREGMANQYGNLGIVYRTRGDLDRAEAMYRKSLAIEEQLGRREGMASDYGNLGNLYLTRGDLDGAEKMYRKSLAIDEELGLREGMASQYGNLGNVYSTRGDLDRAEEMYRKSLAIDEELGRREGMANQYGNLGIVYLKRGDLDRAEEMYRKSLVIDEQLGRREGIAIQYGNLGIAYQTRGDVAKAREYWTKSRDLFAEIGPDHNVAWVQGLLDRLDG